MPDQELEKTIERIVAEKIDGAVSQIKSDLNLMRSEIFHLSLAEKTEQITRDAASEQDMCIRIAEWLAGNMADRVFKPVDYVNAFSQRYGDCGTRSFLFTTMCGYKNILAKGMNFYNFGGTSQPHLAAMAHYDRGWHFFDPMLGGYFPRGGNVLSWEEVLNDPAAAVACRTAFPASLDCENGARVDYASRMAEYYSEEQIRACRSFGFYRESPIVLYPAVDCARLPLKLSNTITELNGYPVVFEDARDQNISSNLTYAPGTILDRFHVQWEFTNAEPGADYFIKMYGERGTHENLHFSAKADGADIIDGAAQIFCTGTPNWRVRARAQRDTFSVLLKYDYDMDDAGVFFRLVEIFRR